MFDEEFGLGKRAVGADTIFDGDDAVFVFAEGCINEAVILGNVAVDDGEVFFLDEASFKGFSKFASGCRIFCDQNDAAGFAVEAVDEIRFEVLALSAGGQIQTGTADEAGHLAVLGGMADESRGFIDHEQIGVLENDIEHPRFLTGKSGRTIFCGVLIYEVHGAQGARSPNACVNRYRIKSGL